MKAILIIKIILSLPKTIYFNFKVFPLKHAIKLPFLISYDVQLKKLYKNSIEINCSKISTFMIKLNFTTGSSGVNIGYKSKGYFDVDEHGKIIFHGKANFSQGISLRVSGGRLEFGDKFQCNKNCFISCSNRITVGNDVLFGWEVNIRDSDGHQIIDLTSNTIQTSSKPVTIGDRVWVGANVDILKGVIIGSENIIGYRSVVTKKFEEQNVIISGYPAKIIKKDVQWNG
ncbi:acyltransferase [Fundicoccus sp. Sow4_F4]|uniref:acyltransferase n=1 Tax=Fundicoccus sp. Sow4_F4 TaxID=3438783 RepID=UPI003F8F6137